MQEGETELQDHERQEMVEAEKSERTLGTTSSHREPVPVAQEQGIRGVRQDAAVGRPDVDPRARRGASPEGETGDATGRSVVHPVPPEGSSIKSLALAKKLFKR